MRSRALLLLMVSGAVAAIGKEASDPEPAYFEPSIRLSGIGVDRERIGADVLAARTDAMIQSQTFGILREPEAVLGAKRITAPGLQAIFRKAEAQSGVPASLLEAIAYLESWGNPRATSPTGPKGIMQIARATARSMGLRVTYARRYRTTTRRVRVRTKSGKYVYRNVRRRTPYSVVVRDDRLKPELAIPAAAKYLARLEQRFGGRDWAVFAYHCGEACGAQMLSLTRGARGASDQPTVAQMFFLGSPSHNLELFNAVRRHMERDYSPTYWFRVMRAQELLRFWREDPKGFLALAEYYRSDFVEEQQQRAPHRLTVWLKNDDLIYRTLEDILSCDRLVKAIDAPEYLGYRLRLKGPGSIAARDPENLDNYLRATPAALGALTYIAYETRRLYAALNSKGERFQPLEVVSLVQPMELVDKLDGKARTDFLAHSSGEVFDIDTSRMPRRQKEALEFVLEDLGWHNHLGFVEEEPRSGRLHIGPSPSSRRFFAQVYEEACEGSVGE